MIKTRTIAPDGTVMLSQRKPRVIIHRKNEAPTPCLSVNHACEALERMWERRVPKAALNTKARWLSEKLSELEMQITFPDSRRGPLPGIYSQEMPSQPHVLAPSHLES